MAQREHEIGGSHGLEPVDDALRHGELGLAGQTAALELALAGASLDEVLQSIVRTARELSGDDARTAIFRVDGDSFRLRFAASAGLSAAYTSAVDGSEISPNTPPCALPAWSGERVIVEDVAADPRWSPYLALARAHDIGACWSFPIRIAGRTVGVIAIHHARPRAPRDRDLESMELLARTAALVLERYQAGEERRRADTARRESDARLRAVYDGTYTSIGIIAPDGILLDCNAASLAAVNARREDVVGRPFWRTAWFAHTPGAADRVREAVALARGGEFVRYELTLARPNGDTRTFDFSLHPVRGSDGQVVYIVPEARDVTWRQQTETERESLLAALREERARLRALILHMPAPIALLVGPEHRHDLVNDAFRRISGGGRDVTGLTVREAFPELAGQGIYERLDTVFATGRAWASQESLVRYDRDGTGVMDSWFDIRFEPVRDADGVVTAILNFAIDVTAQVVARREMERLLQESERARVDAESASARMEAVLASIADPFYLLDKEWRFTHVNDAAEPLLHTTREALLGRTLWEAFPGVAGSEFEGPYREAMREGHNTFAEGYFAPLGTWFDVRTYPWSGGLMVHFRDIGARKVAEREREQLLADAEAARRDAETANRAKAEFLATMSHELRTPLNAIGGYAELMEMGIRGPVSKEQAEDLRRIQVSQRHLLGLVNEVLNYARIETGKVRYDIVDVPLAGVIASVEPLIAPQMAAKGLVFESVPWPGTALVARADGEKVRQVLLNLLSNAIKFTDAPGRVEVTCGAESDRVAIHVRDTGIGIRGEELDRVFEPFVQVDAKLTRAHEGTGLGLAISRDLARGMGGELRVQSTPGAGSTFTLSLPRGG